MHDDLGAGLIAILAGGLLQSMNRTFGIFMGTLIAPLLWLTATIFAWRESAAERGARLSQSGENNVVCPTCGYNLTGLKGSRCPECGTEFTLDQLLTSQPGRAQGELET